MHGVSSELMLVTDAFSKRSGLQVKAAGPNDRIALGNARSHLNDVTGGRPEGDVAPLEPRRRGAHKHPGLTVDGATLTMSATPISATLKAPCDVLQVRYIVQSFNNMICAFYGFLFDALL